MKPITHQQCQYEYHYQNDSAEYGIPDRKINDGQTLRHKRILSVGSGTASDVWFLAHENVVIGVDYAVSGLRKGCQHRVAGVVSDLNFSSSLPFKDRSFDVVICKDILEHLLDPMVVMQEVTRVLKDDGYVVISVPNHFYLPMRIRILFGKGLLWKSISDHSRNYEEWNYMHVRFFTYKGFQRFLEVVGLKVEKFFWDFGNLAHYYNPDMWLEPQIWKKRMGKPLSYRGKLGLYIILPLWIIFNWVFPKSLRQWIVSLLPNLLCAGFYVRARKRE
ncbi:MAG: class I SAM-dependent methyltransferase [Acidobacteria bacterium]|jgi:ubiquinone/menaquinone biosynthesis C-methylase UbiE|nr:MAG: class I SAM-dependent methyltransferase [Acidobacteriota bacterium]